MHELALTCSIVEVAEDAAAGRPVARVTLVIGRLSGVMLDAIRFCFDEVARGTVLDGALLDIEEPAGRARCNACGAEFAMPDLLTPCACGSCDVTLFQGEELSIRSIELREAA
ncbi:MAG TPA: hydrogenase maturation nickel metallochaperone HypA [Stellaceae bacterium]|nr:hydrogenase maturation nickel metallochaperone HypA [Stellaceae bacterium]